MLEVEKRKYVIRGLTPILGSMPASPAIRTMYISSKAPASELQDEEDSLDFIEDKGITVFSRDGDNRLFVWDYVLKGFFKAALNALRTQEGILMERGKVDKYIFIAPRRLFLRRNGEYIIDEDEQLERPLRARSARGEYTALAASEVVNDPWKITFEVTLIPNSSTQRSKPITWEAIEAALDYGRYLGIGQWRNAGYGRFVWKRIEEPTENAPEDAGTSRGQPDN